MSVASALSSAGCVCSSGKDSRKTWLPGGYNENESTAPASWWHHVVNHPTRWPITAPDRIIFSRLILSLRWKHTKNQITWRRQEYRIIFSRLILSLRWKPIIRKTRVSGDDRKNEEHGTTQGIIISTVTITYWPYKSVCCRRAPLEKM